MVLYLMVPYLIETYLTVPYLMVSYRGTMSEGIIPDDNITHVSIHGGIIPDSTIPGVYIKCTHVWCSLFTSPNKWVGKANVAWFVQVICLDSISAPSAIASNCTCKLFVSVVPSCSLSIADALERGCRLQLASRRLPLGEWHDVTASPRRPSCQPVR